MQYIISLDQGTTSSRAIIFDENANVVNSAQVEFKQYYPQSGYVEHDPMDILQSQINVLRRAVESSKINVSDIKAIGITNQRETTIIWDKNTGIPVHNAIVWQCRRTSKICEDLITDGMEQTIKDKTGLVVDAYFSGTKIKWILDTVDNARVRAQNNELLFGTVDTWLVWNLTKEKNHYSDYTNASRTMLYNIHDLSWDTDILNKLDIPISLLPKVIQSSDFFGTLDSSILGHEIPILAVAGDQHAALFGQTCFEEGMVKNTYGTGCFLLMNTGDTPVESKSNLLTTIAWGINGKVEYALEGSIFMGGATIQWLRDELQIISTSAESESLATEIDDNDGVYLVPAFTGLGAPWWDMHARGTILGMSRGSGRAHIARAALESIAYQSNDVMKAMEKDSGIKIKKLKVDGGASRNNFLMQFQSNILGVEVSRPKCIETTALGIAYLAGLKAGIFKNKEDIRKNWNEDVLFSPTMENSIREEKYQKWTKAVMCVKEFAK